MVSPYTATALLNLVRDHDRCQWSVFFAEHIVMDATLDVVDTEQFVMPLAGTGKLVPMSTNVCSWVMLLKLGHDAAAGR